MLLLIALSLGTLSDNGIDTSLSNLWSFGVGTLDPRMIVGINYMNAGGLHGNEPLPLPVVAIIANIPQTVLACCYFLLNALLTAMCLSKEYDNFSKTRKELRVSMPTGYQRSNYFLQIPFKYSIPLNIVSFILHFFFSQSIFLARVVEVLLSGEVIEDTLIDCGYSPIATIISALLCLLVLAAVFCLGLRRYSGIIPIAGSCSAAISAACHRPESDEKAAWHAVKWGETKYYGPRPIVCHLAFSSEDVFTPVAGNWYAGEKNKDHME